MKLPTLKGRSRRDRRGRPQRKGRGLWRGSGGSVRSRNARNLADRPPSECEGPYLFPDGTVGVITVSDGGDFWEEWEEETDEDGNYVNDPEDLMMDGEEYEGEIYIDRYRLSDGTFIQGGCYLYWPQDTLGSWCARNGEPVPVEELPEWAQEALEEDGKAGFMKVKGYVEKMTGGKFRRHSL